MNTVVVTGGRDYDDKFRLYEVLGRLKIDELVQGGATGADELARQWCAENGVKCTTIRADWEKHGRAAGPIRNEQMLMLYPNSLVVVFHGGRGTWHCRSVALDRGMTVLETINPWIPKKQAPIAMKGILNVRSE